jgi:hypothetical protein
VTIRLKYVYILGSLARNPPILYGTKQQTVIFVVIYTVFDLIRYLVPGLSLYLQLKVDDFFCPNLIILRLLNMTGWMHQL